MSRDSKIRYLTSKTMLQAESLKQLSDAQLSELVTLVDGKEKRQVKIGITGAARAGKSELAGYASLYYDFQVYDFSDELKRVYHELFPNVPREPKPRAAYQKWGQIVRELDSDVWVNATLRRVEYYKPERSMVTGLRQQHEFDRLKEEGYVIIRINAPQQLRINRMLEAGDDFTIHDLTHETELLIDTFDVDFEVTNDSSLTNIYEQFDAIMEQLGVSRTV